MGRDYKCNKPLRLPQQQLMDACFDDFNAGHKRVMAVAPTGMGKSACMGGIAKFYTAKRGDEIVLIISHLGLLVEQSGSSFKEFFNLESDILKAERMPSPDARVVLSTAQSTSILDKIMYWKSTLPEGVKVGLILIDEVHINSGTDRADKILELYFPDARVIGFTGTPYKENKSMQHLFEKVSFSISLGEVISMGMLVPPRMHSMVVEDKKNLEEVMSKVISTIKANHANDQCVVFMKTIADAMKMEEMLEELGFKAQSITSKTDDKYRDVVLTKFRNRASDAPQILTTVDVLSVGFDAPQLQAILMPYGTGSVATYLQRIGRVLRTYLGKTHGDIYIGSVDPQVIDGKWEKIHKKAMNAGQRHDNAELDYELNSDLMDEVTKSKTLETINMAKAIKKKGMLELADQVMNRQFPTEFLDHLVPFKKFSSKAKMTSSQASLLKRNGVNSDGMNKNAAASVIDAIAKTQGWYKPSATVPSGKHAGQPVNQVSFSYINLVSKRGSRYYNAELASFFERNK